MVVLLNLDGTVEKRAGNFFGMETVAVPKVGDLDMIFLAANDYEVVVDTYLTELKKRVILHHYTKIGDLEGTAVYRETP